MQKRTRNRKQSFGRRTSSKRRECFQLGHGIHKGYWQGRKEKTVFKIEKLTKAPAWVRNVHDSAWGITGLSILLEDSDPISPEKGGRISGGFKVKGRKWNWWSLWEGKKKEKLWEGRETHWHAALSRRVRAFLEKSREDGAGSSESTLALPSGSWSDGRQPQLVKAENSEA